MEGHFFPPAEKTDLGKPTLAKGHFFQTKVGIFPAKVGIFPAKVGILPAKVGIFPVRGLRKK